MELEALPDATRLSDRVLRVLGQNPGKFTLQGTNTYIIGQDRPYVLIDTGEGNDAYPAVLEKALDDLSKPRSTHPEISDIILSHRHHDHIGGLPSVLALLHRRWTKENAEQKYIGPRLHKFPLPNDEDVDAVLGDVPSEQYTAYSASQPLHPLSDNQVVTHVNLKVVHSPGHTVDSISMLMPSDNAIFTADTVLGQGTAVFEDLSAYMASLSRILPLAQSGQILYPGHGPVVKQGAELISTYISHRTERENQILGVLESRESITTMDIVKLLYKDYPESLHLPAARGVDLHLRKLRDDKRAVKMGGEGFDTKWKTAHQS